MTKEQVLNKVRTQIKEMRGLLDDLMYGGEYLSDTEFDKVREAYDFLCRANDKLP